MANALRQTKVRPKRSFHGVSGNRSIAALWLDVAVPAASADRRAQLAPTARPLRISLSHAGTLPGPAEGDVVV